MNNRILIINDGRVYYCADCPYRNRETGFCGFCMRKVMDDLEAIKAKKKDGFELQQQPNALAEKE